MNGRLEVIYCDFFKLDPRNRGTVTPPVMTSDMLFQYLGMKAHPWKKGDFCLSVEAYLIVCQFSLAVYQACWDLCKYLHSIVYGQLLLN